MMAHLVKHDLITPSQHGFVPWKSCATNLIETIDVITETFNRGFEIDMIFLDFSKAFDLVSHEALLYKLERYGFNGTILLWIKAFLLDRKQRVVIGEFASDWSDVKSGVPQGSVLGPLLFILFVNDIPEILHHISKLFADDCKLLAIVKNCLDRKLLQDDLDKIVKWSQEWRMLFNLLKCKVMHLNKSGKNKQTDSVYTMCNLDGSRHLLDKTTSERDLGIQITDNMKWGEQAKIAAIRANSVLGSLKRCFKVWTALTVKTLYCALVRPHLEYAVSAWNPYRKGDIKILEQVQRRATKLVPELKDLHYEERLRKIGITSLAERRERGDVIQYFKIESGLNRVKWYHQNNYANSINVTGPASDIRGFKHRRTRQFTKCVQRDNFLSNRVVPLWNKLPPYVVASKNTNDFKNSYDNYKELSHRLL